MFNRSFQTWSAVLGCGAILLLLSPAADSQEVSAGMTGAVTDPSGAAITGAAVTARDMDRGTVWTAATNTEGIYAFPRVPAGNYEIRFGAAGFRTAVRRNVVLELNARVRLDVTMELGM